MKTKREGNILNQSEINANRRVQQYYNLRLSDFPTENDYDDFLEEKEWILYNLIHQTNVNEAEKKLEQFKEKNSKIIEIRSAELMETSRNRAKPQALPLQSQIKFQAKATKANSAKLAMMSIQYSDASFKLDIERRLEQWTENDPNVEVWDAGGLPRSVLVERCKQELKDSLFIEK